MVKADVASVIFRPIIFENPERQHITSAWSGHIPFAFWITDVHRPRILVELGTQAGVSYSAFAQAVQRLKLPAQCFAVDTWKGDEHAGFYADAVFEEFSRYHASHFPGFSRLIRSTFDEALAHFSDNSIDLLHIDGLHTLEAVAHDFASWLPKLSARGVVLFHDINVREDRFGVWKLWEQLRDRYPHFAFNHSHGLGVLGVGTEFAPELTWLFNLSKKRGDIAAATFVRNVFERLGAGLVERTELKHVASELAAAKIEREKSVRASEIEKEQLLAAQGELNATQRARDETALQFESANRQLFELRPQLETLTNERDEFMRLSESRQVELAKSQERARAINHKRDEIAEQLRLSNQELMTIRERATELEARLASGLEARLAQAYVGFLAAWHHPFSSRRRKLRREKISTEAHRRAAKHLAYGGEIAGQFVSLGESVPLADPVAKLIAFYLPQFHPIPENDEFWGRGFTEWFNVSRGKPQFIGHHQPRLPGELGFYDLRVLDVQKRQVELAKLFGIGGFCFYLYWFAGRRLLEAPIKQYLAHSELDLPFCLCWANENWTRRWDGLDSEILVAQQHSEADDLSFIRYVSEYFKDARYIRVEGKPLLLVYRAELLPSAEVTAARWRAWCRDNGFGEIFLACTQSFMKADPKVYGFDAAIEFPPNNSSCPSYPFQVTGLNPDFSGLLLDWDYFRRCSGNYETPEYPLFRGVCPTWDNEARRPGAGTLLAGSTPAGYREWLKNAVDDTVKRFPDKSERLVFINAWNEWAEGAYLEPDQKYGYAYLQATRDALVDAARPDVAEARKKLVIVGHDAHPHGAQFLALNLFRELKSEFRIDCECVLLGEGLLKPNYLELGKLHSLAGKDARGQEARALAARLKAEGASAAICNTAVSGLFAQTLKEAGIRVVSLIHESSTVIETYEGHGLREHAKAVATSADAVVFPASSVMEAFSQFAVLDPSRVHIFPQGLYKKNRFSSFGAAADARRLLREKLGLNSDTRIVLAVGFGDFRKGVDLFVDIGIRTFAKTPNVKFVWAGSLDSASEAEVLSRINRSGLSAQFVFAGFQSDTDLFFAGADVLALTSREDPFPAVILEAFDAKLPVVAFRDTGGFEEVFQRKVGQLVPYLDTEVFSNAVTGLLSDPTVRAEMGNTASDLVSREFSFRRYLFRLLELAGKNYPRVSVIVLNYNHCRFLEKRLSSIAAQTMPTYEIHVVDDHSVDGSIEWLGKELGRILPGSELTINESNLGSGFIQWLRTVERAQGDYIWIAESDDIADPEFLAETIRAFDDPSVVLSYCQSRQMNGDGEVLCENYLDYVADISPAKWTAAYVNEGVDEIRSALSIKNTIPNVSAVLFRRGALLAALRSLGGTLEQYKVAGDWAVYLEVLRHGRIAFCPRSLNSHRRHAAGVTLASFDLSQLIEIMSVQRKARENFAVPAWAYEAANSYAQRVFEQFKLQTVDASTIYEHPLLMPFTSQKTDILPHPPQG